MIFNKRSVSTFSALIMLLCFVFTAFAEETSLDKIYTDSLTTMNTLASSLGLSEKKQPSKTPFGITHGSGVVKSILTPFNTGLYNMPDAVRMPIVFNEPESVKIPVLLYHHVVPENGYGDSVISVSLFREHMDAVKNAGYNTISTKELINYVYYGDALPEKPILITFDDGYYSNYELAYPILKQNEMKATFFAIGWAIGKDKYKDGKSEMFPHFGFEEAREMLASGLIEVQSHTFDCHQNPLLEDGVARESVLPFENENDEQYEKFLTDDFYSFDTALFAGTGQHTYALAYPHGDYSEKSEEILSSLGVLVTFSTEYDKPNTVTQGEPKSVMAMCRFTVSEYISSSELMKMIDGVYGDNC